MSSFEPSAVAGLRDGLDLLDGRALADRLVEIERAIRALEAAAVAVVVEADRRQVYAEDGHASVRGWLRATTRCADVDVTHRVRAARLAVDVPEVLEQLGAGELGIAQLRELARARANPRCGERLGDVIEPLVDVATTQPHDVFVQVVREWERLADADGAHRTADEAHDGRRASITTTEDTTYVSAAVGNAQGAWLTEVLDAYVAAELAADWEALRERIGDDATASMLRRTDRQRRADALVAIFTAAADGDRGAGVQVEPVVDIVIEQEVLEEQLSAMVEDRSPRFDASDPSRCRCRTSDGIPLDPADAVAAMLIGHVRRVVTDGAGVIIDLGRRARCFTGSARAAALLQAALDGQRCVWPGCRHRHTQVDHVIPWAHDGPTSPGNCGPLCGRHNRWKTSGYRTWRDAGGVWHTRRPDGTEIRAA